MYRHHEDFIGFCGKKHADGACSVGRKLGRERDQQEKWEWIGGTHAGSRARQKRGCKIRREVVNPHLRIEECILWPKEEGVRSA